MVITGSALFVEPGTNATVREKLAAFPAVTFQAQSDAGTELVVNLEAEDHTALEQLCGDLKEQIAEIVEITHIYVWFEDEIEKIRSGAVDRKSFRDPKPGDEE